MKYVGSKKNKQDIATLEDIDNAGYDKADKLTGAATTIAYSDLDTDRALISNGSGKVAVSAVTSTELEYLDGVTSNVQTQLDGKALDADVVHKTGNESISGEKTFIAPEKIANTEQTTTKFKTSNGGAVIIGKEAANNGTMLRLDQVDGTPRLRFRASDAAGAMIWEQPEQGAELYIDLGERGVDYHRISFPTSGYGTLAFQSAVDYKVPKTRKINGHALSEDVNLTASDVGALPDTTTIPTKTSDLDNDSGFITSAQAPVQSVNGKTGAVTLDIPTIPDNLVKYQEVVDVEATPNINANTLEGHSADYFATATSVSTLNNTVSALSTSVDTNAGDIAALDADMTTAKSDISTLQTDVGTLKTTVGNHGTQISAVENDIDNLQSGKLNKSGGTMTGALIAQTNTNYTTRQVRNVIISTADPSGGSSGDIWIKYST